MRITHHGHEIDLLGERAVFLPKTSTLVLSDVHLGKATTFQSQGIPVPGGDDLNDLTRITRLLKSTKANQLVIAGDLLHSPFGTSPELVESLNKWLEQCPASMTLVCGNHDQRSFRTHPMESVPDLEFDGLRIIHDPDEADDRPAICGHLHPVIRIREKPRRSLRSPCFWLHGNSLVLPSFGTFTGGHPIQPAEGDRVFAPFNEKVVELPKECWK